MEEPFQPQSDIVILSSRRRFTDIWKYIKREKSWDNGHYEGKCNFCDKSWKRGKPASLRAYIANHCTGTDLPADVRSYFIKIVANENEKKREYSSDNEIENNVSKKQKITKNGKGKASDSANINDHYQKKEKLNSNQIEEIDREII